MKKEITLYEMLKDVDLKQALDFLIRLKNNSFKVGECFTYTSNNKIIYCKIDRINEEKQTYTVTTHFSTIQEVPFNEPSILFTTPDKYYNKKLSFDWETRLPYRSNFELIDGDIVSLNSFIESNEEILYRIKKEDIQKGYIIYNGYTIPLNMVVLVSPICRQTFLPLSIQANEKYIEKLEQRLFDTKNN
ncbi:MAG: hypothetical protein N2043_01595 [Ignavibacterium sp.]|nr:hypothetical protein [Ignavibacterium sp.]